MTWRPIPEPEGVSYEALRNWLRRQSLSAQQLQTGTLAPGIVIQSSDFVSGTSGWQIDGDGNAEFNDVTVRGTIIGSVFKTAASGQRLEIDGSTGDSFITFYDSSDNVAGYVGFEPTGYGTNTMVLSNEGLNDIELDAGAVSLIASGSSGFGVWVRSNAAGAVPGTPFSVWNSAATVSYLKVKNATPFLVLPQDAGLIQFVGSGPKGLAVHDSSESSIESALYYRTSPDTWGFEWATGKKVEFDAGLVRAEPGGWAAPAYSFHGDTNTGMGWRSADTLFFATGGSESFFIDSSGNINFQNHILFNILQLRLNKTGIAYSFQGDTNTGWGSEGVNQIQGYVGGTKVIEIGGTSFIADRVYAETTGGAANVHVQFGGKLWRSTSTREAKRNIETLTELPRFRPVVFQSKLEADGDRQFAGFIAEEVAEAFPLAGADDGENYDVRAIVAVHEARIQELEKKLEELTA